MDRDGTNLPHPSSLFIVRTLLPKHFTATDVCVLAKEEARSITADVRISSTVQNSKTCFMFCHDLSTT